MKRVAGFTDFQHIELLKLTRAMKDPMIAVSGYYSELDDEPFEMEPKTIQVE